MNYKYLETKWSGMYGPKKVEVNGQFRISHNKELLAQITKCNRV